MVAEDTIILDYHNKMHALFKERPQKSIRLYIRAK
jgi:hypothetical protein